MRSGFLAAAALFGTPFICATAEPSHPPIEAYGRLPSLMEAEVSPSGKRIALLMQAGADFEMRIYDTEKNALSHLFTVEPMKIRGLQFGDDDHVILMASETTRTYGFRGKYEYSGAISVNLETGKSRQLLSLEDSLYPAQSGIGNIIGRLPSGQLLMPAYVGSYGSDPSFSILKANQDSGHGQSYARGTPRTIDWFVDSEGEPLVRESYDNDKDVYLLEYHDGRRWNELVEVDSPEIPLSILAVTNDEQGVYFKTSQDEDEEFSALSRMNFDESVETSLFSREGADIAYVLTDMNRHLVGVRYSGTMPSYDFDDEALRESYESVSSKLAGAMVELDSWSDDRSRILYRVFDGYKVDYWLLHERDTDKLTRLAYSRADIPEDAVGAVYVAQYPARDGLTIPVILTTPPGIEFEAGMNLPTIVMPHGGPAAYDIFDFDWMAQFFANRGYFVLQPNFRGSTGFGRSFRKAGEGEWGGKMQDDVTDGVRAMIAGGYADPDRICIVGASYGGYSALAGGAFTPDLYKCVAAIAPVSDVDKMLQTERADMGRNHWVVTYWERLIAQGDASRDKLRAISPAEHAGKFAAPVLLIHGEDDTVVRYDQSQDMERALERAGKQVQLIKLKGGDHWLSDSETRLQTLKALDRFLAEHLLREDDIIQ